MRFIWKRADVGIVMPVYKQDPDYLETALRSVLRQSYGRFSFVIVSDGAPSETVAVIRRVTKGDTRVRLILKEKNEGVAKALNTGFRHLMKKRNIKYLTWVSSDNVYYPTFIEALRSALAASSEEVGLSFSTFTHVDADRVPLTDPQYKEFYSYQNQPKENLLDVCFIGVSFMYRKRAAAKIDGYRLEPVEDYDYWLRLTEHCDIVYVPEVLMEYRTNSPESISALLSNSIDHHRRWRNAYQVAKKEARTRRGIPPAVTILYPVRDGSQAVIDKLEQLLEQSFSNYLLLIMDVSPDRSAMGAVNRIQDPRICIASMPGAGDTDAVRNMLHEVETPYTLIYGQGAFPTTPYVLYSLFLFNEQYTAQPYGHLLLSSYENHFGRVEWRLGPLDAAPVHGQLYLTNRLHAWMRGDVTC